MMPLLSTACAPRPAPAGGPRRRLAASAGSRSPAAPPQFPSAPRSHLLSAAAPQVRQVIWRLFEMCPTPAAAVAADQAAIRDLIRPLGLFNKRAAAVQRFSLEYAEKQVGAECGRDAGRGLGC